MASGDGWESRWALQHGERKPTYEHASARVTSVGRVGRPDFAGVYLTAAALAAFASLAPGFGFMRWLALANVLIWAYRARHWLRRLITQR